MNEKQKKKPKERIKLNGKENNRMSDKRCHQQVTFFWRICLKHKQKMKRLKMDKKKVCTKNKPEKKMNRKEIKSTQE